MKAMIIKAAAGLGTWFFRRAFHLAIRAWVAEADEHGAAQFTWERSRAARRWLKREILEARQWAMRKFPHAEKTLGAAGRFTVWVLESDELASEYNYNPLGRRWIVPRVGPLPPTLPLHKQIDAHRPGGYVVGPVEEKGAQP